MQHQHYRQGANPTLTKDRGYIVYQTTIHSRDGLTGGVNSERNFTISTTWFREVIWTVSLNGIDATRPSLVDADGWGNTATDYSRWNQVIIDGVIMHKWARIR